ncbi:imidazole glycerol phosphate synthase subunit HisH [Kytococcus sedentarius]|uniref:imidazole glycerol phosphate synthase subunit HisH n=1 Tax=Kytococcus sedentarius TaxID=1276 RepID=UPI0035BBC5C3
MSAPDVVLVDAGGANIASVQFALARLGIDAPVTSDAGRIRSADRVVLPGVGAAEAAMRRLRELDLVEVLRSLEQPVAGVCLGMQLLYEGSTEGAGGRSVDAGAEPVECLGLVPGVVTEMPGAPGVRVPHMGWNVLEPGPGAEQGPLAGELATAWAGPSAPRAYFVHSWSAPVTQDSVAVTTHGHPFTAVVQRGTVTGMQFHPERSGDLGSRLLAAFCGVTPGGTA